MHKHESKTNLINNNYNSSETMEDEHILGIEISIASLTEPRSQSYILQ